MARVKVASRFGDVEERTSGIRIGTPITAGHRGIEIVDFKHAVLASGYRFNIRRRDLKGIEVTGVVITPASGLVSGISTEASRKPVSVRAD